MYTKRLISPRLLCMFAWKPVLFFLAISSAVYVLYDVLGHKQIAIPFLPIGTMGTAVAFYIGFKNNSAYDRLWDARKIWGSITNSSRTLGAWITNWNLSADIAKEKQQILYRHIAYVNTLRIQLRKTTVWNNNYYNSISKRFGHVESDHMEEELQEIYQKYLSTADRDAIKDKGNRAVHILAMQSKQFADMKRRGAISEFEHSNLESLVLDFYNQQGASERIKTFPFPRQYGYFSRVFVMVFFVLLPFGLVGEMAKTGYVWLVIPFSTLISWMFETMEEIGDSSENPFENGINDVPITAISRNIEIDLLEMLGETNLPERIKPINDILY